LEKRAERYEADAGKEGVERLNPKGLRVGDKFTVGGKAFRVVEDRDESGETYRVLKHGEDYEIPVDSFRNGIPADKDTFRPGRVGGKAKRRETVPAVPDDGIPFSRYDAAADAWVPVALARDADPTRKGGRKADGEGHWITVGAQEGEDGRKTGGTPVFVRGSKIVKGPAHMVGNHPERPTGGKPADRDDKPAAKADAPAAKREPEKRDDPAEKKDDEKPALKTRAEWRAEAERLADASGMEDDEAKSADLLKQAEAAQAKADAMKDDEPEAKPAEKPTPKAEPAAGKMPKVGKMQVGDSFRLPSTNSHDKDGFRTYTVVGKTADGVKVEDEHGYASQIRDGSPDAKLVTKTGTQYKPAGKPAGEAEPELKKPDAPKPADADKASRSRPRSTTPSSTSRTRSSAATGRCRSRPSRSICRRSGPARPRTRSRSTWSGRGRTRTTTSVSPTAPICPRACT
jgi:hypothetical protein